MDIIFDIIENNPTDSIIILTVLFEEKYSISIGKDNNSMTIYFYNSTTRDILKFFGQSCKSKKYYNVKKYIQDTIDNIAMTEISGISNIDNIDYLKKYFLVTNNLQTNVLVDIKKTLC